MANDKTTNATVLAGVGFMHPAFRDPDTALWSNQSSYVEREPVPGAAELQTSTSALAFDVLGNQSANGILYGRCLAPGHANGDLGIGHQASTDARYLGWDPPHVISGWEAIDWTDGSGSGEYTASTAAPHVQRLVDGHKLGVIYHHVKSGTPNNTRVSFSYRSVGGTWATATVYKQSAVIPNSQLFHPCFLELDSGELLCWHWIYDTTNDKAQIRQHISRDQGATWTMASTACLPGAIDIDSSSGNSTGRIRAAIDPNGNVLMMVYISDNASVSSPNVIDKLRQYASSNFGATFTLVKAASQDITDNETGLQPDIFYKDGLFHAFWIRRDNAMGGGKAYLYKSASAFTNLFDLTGIDINPGSGTGLIWASTTGTAADGDLAAWCDDDDSIYVVGRYRLSGGSFENAAFIIRSKDGGTNWVAMSNTGFTFGGSGEVGAVWSHLDTDNYLKAFTATSWAGASVVICNHISDTASFDNSLTMVTLGGWTTETMSGLETFPSDDTRVGFTDQYLPIELPGNAGWTKASVGTSSEELAAGKLKLTTASLGGITYSKTETSTMAQGWNPIRVHIIVESGGDLNSDGIYIKVRTSAVEISLRFDATGFKVYDHGASADIGSAVTVENMTTTGVEIIVGLSSAGLALSYRKGGSGNPAQKFLVGQETTSIGTSSSSATDIIWGHGSISGARVSYWSLIEYTVGSYVGEGKDTRIDSPDELFWRVISNRRSYLSDGVELRDAGSQGFAGDIVHITATSDYSVKNVWPRKSLSPRRPFMTKDTTAEITIALRFDSDQGSPASSDPTHSIGRDVICLMLEGINFRTAYFEGRNPAGGGAGTWDTLHTFDSAEDLSGLPWRRKGNTVEPSTAAAHAGTAPYLLGDEFVGSSFEFSSTKIRLISSQTAGLWKGKFGGQTEERPTLLLDGIDASEGNVGTAGRIWSSRVVAIVSLRGSHYTGYRLRIPVQTTASGRFEIGNLLCGPLHIFGMSHDYGRRLERFSSVERTELDDGTVFSRVLAPNGDIVELPFTSGFHTRQVDRLIPDPDFLKLDTNAAAKAITSVKATPYQLRSLMDQLHSEGYPAEPVCLMPRIPVITSGSSAQFNRSFDMVYGEASTRIRLEQVQGEERAGKSGKSGEVFRIPLLSVRRLR